MTTTQIKGILRFHKSAYKAYKSALVEGLENNISLDKLRVIRDNMVASHARMISTYLQLRATR